MIRKDAIELQLISEIRINGAHSKPVFKDIWFIAIINFLFQNCIHNPYFALKWWFKYQHKNLEVTKNDAETKTFKLLNMNI